MPRPVRARNGRGGGGAPGGGAGGRGGGGGPPGAGGRRGEERQLEPARVPVGGEQRRHRRGAEPGREREQHARADDRQRSPAPRRVHRGGRRLDVQGARLTPPSARRGRRSGLIFFNDTAPPEIYTLCRTRPAP